jgi:hypothetical protein
MELTRRDALAALASAGILAGGTAAALARDGFADESGPANGEGVDELVAALVATAEAVYPSAVENTRPFVESYASTKLAERPDFRAGAAETLGDLDAEAEITFEQRYAALSAVDSETVLRRVGAAAADPVADGTAAERVRYYFVNEVLYALFTSPTGGELVGIENPQGHPGGTDTYQRGPPG